MTLTEFDPDTRMPVAVRHESETGWGRKLLAEHGVAQLEEYVVADLVEEVPENCPAAAGGIETVTTVDGDVTQVTAWARCTAAACVATGAALDTLNTEPFVHLLAAKDLTAAVAACRAQLALPAMQFTDTSADAAVVWAYRTGVLREVLMYLSFQALTYTAHGESPAEARLHTAVESVRARGAALGLDLRGGPSDLAQLNTADDTVWERTARALHTLVADLAPLVEQHPVRTGAR
ncbi:hypothetical protein [Streptomyces sp. NPDC001536]|uniref:hypothetical protein n=1 Tax=Streptomyces sp. NPDC001536 TaxID=3364583 RepID=UPI00369A22BF